MMWWASFLHKGPHERQVHTQRAATDSKLSHSFKSCAT